MVGGAAPDPQGAHGASPPRLHAHVLKYVVYNITLLAHRSPESATQKPAHITARPYDTLGPPCPTRVRQKPFSHYSLTLLHTWSSVPRPKACKTDTCPDYSLTLLHTWSSETRLIECKTDTLQVSRLCFSIFLGCDAGRRGALSGFWVFPTNPRNSTHLEGWPRPACRPCSVRRGRYEPSPKSARQELSHSTVVHCYTHGNPRSPCRGLGQYRHAGLALCARHMTFDRVWSPGPWTLHRVGQAPPDLTSVI